MRSASIRDPLVIKLAVLNGKFVVAFVIAFIFVIDLSNIEVECKERVGLERLIDNIFSDNQYNPLVRPVDKNGITNVFTELKLLQIDLDEKYQELVSTVWIEMSWEDERLSWNESDFDNIREITLPVSKLWVPDIVLQNGVGRNEYLNEMKYFNPWISSTGLITWVPEIRLHSRCKIKVSDFPFDTQCCEINFYSWAHTINQMKIQQFGDKNVTNVTHLSYNTEWQVYHTCALHKVIVTSEELHWWVTSYVIYIKRHTAYHIYNLLMPCFVLSMLSMLLFLLPPDSGEKVTLGVTILLAFFVNSLVVSNYTPEAASDLPVIGVYYIFNIGLVSVSIGTSVCVLNFHFRGHKLTPVPLWLKYALIIKDERIQRAAERANQRHNPDTTPATTTTKTLTTMTTTTIVSNNNNNNSCNNINGKLNTSSSSNELVYREMMGSNNKSNYNYHNKAHKQMNGEAAMIGSIDDHNETLTISNNNTPQKSNNNLLFCSSKLYAPSTRMIKTLLVSSSSSPSSSRRHHGHHGHHGHHHQNNQLHHRGAGAGTGAGHLKLAGFDNESGDEIGGIVMNNNNTVVTAGGVVDETIGRNNSMVESSGTLSSTGTDWSQMRDNLGKIHKLLRRSVYILERNRLRQKTFTAITDEWKEVASRIDLILFLIASTIVIFTPMGLFGKFFVRDDFPRSVNNTCGCDNVIH